MEGARIGWQGEIGCSLRRSGSLDKDGSNMYPGEVKQEAADSEEGRKAALFCFYRKLEVRKQVGSWVEDGWVSDA